MIRQSFFPTSFKRCRALPDDRSKTIDSKSGLNASVKIPKRIIQSQRNFRKRGDEDWSLASLGENRSQTEDLKNKKTGRRILGDKSNCKIEKHSFMVLSNRKELTSINRIRPKFQTGAKMAQEFNKKKAGSKISSRLGWGSKVNKLGKFPRQCGNFFSNKDVENLLMGWDFQTEEDTLIF